MLAGAIALTVAAVLAPQQPVPMLPSIDIKFGLLVRRCLGCVCMLLNGDWVLHIGYAWRSTSSQPDTLQCVAYCFWGIAQAANPIIESILADSVPTGTDSHLPSHPTA